MLRSLPNWAARVAAAHTIPRELRINDEYRFGPASFSSMAVPTLLLLGGSRPPMFKNAVEAVRSALSNARTGQQHTAMNTAPGLFLREVLDFLLESTPGR